MIKKWHTLESRTLADYRIFTVQQVRRRSPRTGHDHQFFILEAGDWINVIPITPEGNVIFIRQFRHGTGEITLEIPGGMVDEEDGCPAVAARRELLEETGYDADEFIHIGTVAPNPAFLNNRCHTFLARNARWAQPPHFDGAEDIAVTEIALDAVPQMIADGRITHALVVAAFYHLEHGKL